MDTFSIPWKHQKTLRFRFYVFRGQRMGALGTNGLTQWAIVPAHSVFASFIGCSIILIDFFHYKIFHMNCLQSCMWARLPETFHRRNVYTRLSFCSSFSMLLTHFWPMFTFYTPWKHLKWWLWAYILGKVRNSKLLLAKRKNRIHLVSDLEDNFHKKCLHIKNFGTSS